MKLELTKPLVIFDLETTSADPSSARIVEASFTRHEPGESPMVRTRRLNPGIPIPAESTAIHGITDADVAECLTFRQVARGLLDFLDGADLAGFNVKRFDLRVLCAEFARCGIEFPLAGREIVDVCVMFHRLHPRDLTAAVSRYTGSTFAAHSAAGDVRATCDVLDAMLDQHGLPRTVSDLAAEFGDPAVDVAGCLVRRDGAITFAVGKHRGKSLAEVAKRDPGYLRWVLGGDFLSDVKALCREALACDEEATELECVAN